MREAILMSAVCRGKKKDVFLQCLPFPLKQVRAIKEYHFLLKIVWKLKYIECLCTKVQEMSGASGRLERIRSELLVNVSVKEVNGV